jgi:hypothetical protein
VANVDKIYSATMPDNPVAKRASLRIRDLLVFNGTNLGLQHYKNKMS